MWILEALSEVGGTLMMGALFTLIGVLLVLREKHREERMDYRVWSRDGREVR